MAELGTFDALIDITEPAMRPIVERLRAVVSAIHPGGVETVRLGDRAATYGVGPKKMKHGYAYILPYTQHVNLGFYQGASLPDPEGLLEGTGKKLRHIEVRSLDDIDRPAITGLIEAALQERRENAEL